MHFVLEAGEAGDHEGNTAEDRHHLGEELQGERGYLFIAGEARDQGEAAGEQDAQEQDLAGDIVLGEDFQPAAFGGCEVLLVDVRFRRSGWTPIGQVIEDGAGA